MAVKRKSLRSASPITLLIAAILLFLAQSAYWVNHTIFDQANFTRITTTELLTQSSRDAIANTVINKALQNRPIIKRVAGERASSLISGLLGSDLSDQAVSTLSSKTYAYVTASDRQDIKIDLTGIKAPIQSLVSIAQNNGVSVPSSQYRIPDEIVLVRSDAFPDLSGTVRLMLWLAPLLWLGTIVLFGLYIYVGRADYARRVYTAGAAIVAVSVIGLLATPFIPPPIAAAVPNIELRPVVENLSTGFLAPFRSQMYYMLGGSLIVLLVFNQRFNVLAAARTLISRVGGSGRRKTKKRR